MAVQVATLRPEPVSDDIRFSATVRERHRFELSFKVPGTIAALMKVKEPNGRLRDVHEGDVVGADRPLAKLDDADYRRRVEMSRERLAQAEARQRAAQAAVTAARTTFARIKSLRASEAVAQQVYDDTLARRDAAEADLDAAGREVRAATVALQQAEDDCGNCALVAPMANATVSRKFIEVNQRVPAGQPVFELMDLSQVRVAFGVPDTMLGQFQIGQTVALTADSFQGQRFQGRVTKILPAADLKTRTFEVEVTIDAPQGLRPGMVVTIIVGRQSSAVLIPMTAVLRAGGEGQYAVFTVVADHGRQIARRRQVRLDGVDDNRIRLVEGVGSEVRAGDAIVVTGAFRLTDGQEVRVLELPQRGAGTAF
jgi:multidrug efflux system membrane fusion protein